MSRDVWRGGALRTQSGSKPIALPHVSLSFAEPVFPRRLLGHGDIGWSRHFGGALPTIITLLRQRDQNGGQRPPLWKGFDSYRESIANRGRDFGIGPMDHLGMDAGRSRLPRAMCEVSMEEFSEDARPLRRGNCRSSRGLSLHTTRRWWRPLALGRRTWWPGRTWPSGRASGAASVVTIRAPLGAERVADRNGTTSGVYFGIVNSQKASSKRAPERRMPR